VTADVFHAVESQALGIVLATVLLATPLAVWRASKWLKKHIVTPLKTLVEMKQTQDANASCVAQLTVDVDVLTVDVAAVKYEVNPNNGSSLRDSVDRNETVTNSIDTRVGAVEVALAGLKTGQGNAAQTAEAVAHTAEDVASDLAHTRVVDAEDVASKALDTAAGLARKTKATAKALSAAPAKRPQAKRAAPKKPTKGRA
jgi:hypothetical protein